MKPRRLSISREIETNHALDAYPGVRAWLARVEALPGFVPMVGTAVGLRKGE